MREVYRASILSSNSRNDQTQKIDLIPEEISKSEQSLLESNDSKVKSEDIGDEGAEEYPGGMRAFLENSKLHLVSPDDINNNLKRVQQLVNIMSKTRIKLPRENYQNASLDKDEILSVKINLHNDYDSTYIDSDTSLNTPISTLHVRQKSGSSKKSINVVPSTKIESTSNNNRRSSTVSSSFINRQNSGYKRPKNKSTPRYLDVFTKQKSVNEIQEVKSNSVIIANTRFSAKFEQNWKPLTVSVVNIEL